MAAPAAAEAPFYGTVVRTSPPTPATLSVMQFNVLAHQLEPPPTVPSDPASVACVQFAERLPLNVAHVVRLCPAVVVLEEVDEVEAYQSALAAVGYELLIAERKPVGADDDSSVPRDATCVFVVKDVVRVVKAPEVCRFDPSRSQFCILVHLALVATGTEFVLVAAHAKAGRKMNLEAVRLGDAKEIVSKYLPAYCGVKTARECAGGRIVWATDFNAGPHTYGGKYPSLVVPWMLGATAPPPEQPSEVPANAFSPPNPFPFESASVNFAGEHPLLTTCKERDGAVIAQTIDFVFVAKGAAKCTGHLPCPVKDAAELAPCYLPNPGRWGSDHLSVYVELEFAV